MKTTIDTYPLFEPNQVLTSEHLNTVVGYLEEQERLTRANLVGVGISCGLGVSFQGGAVRLARGCAVSSLGHLLIEQEDTLLTGFSAYTLPASDAYAPFLKDDGSAIELWELRAEGGTALAGSPGFLSGKSLLLFLERETEELSECSPGNCDDKGAEFNYTLRCLLARDADVERIAARCTPPLDDARRRALPVLRMPRWDVPRTALATSRELLASFQDVIKKGRLVTVLGSALSAAYAAFEPILRDAHPADPFGAFRLRYGFLEATPVQANQVRFLQYSMDLFSDLLAAYEEFRRLGLEYDCVCCPPADWFPRHVVLGPGWRTRWHPAGAAACDCAARGAALVTLFTRMVRMAGRFDDTPERSGKQLSLRGEMPIRITPSRRAGAPLSERCIPYYYDFGGVPPLYRLWNPALAAQGRANCNQAYRAGEFSPPPPDWIRTPLEFDLASHDFLRIEGHLGQDFRVVLERLQELRERHRLPFDLVAVRTGKPDASLELDPDEHACRFQDLEAAYRVLRDEIACLVKKAVAGLGHAPLKRAGMLATGVRASIRAPQAAPVGLAATLAVRPAPVTLLKPFAFASGTIGAAFTSNLEAWGSGALTLPGETLVVNSTLSVLNLLVQLLAQLSADLQDLEWEALEALVKELQGHGDAIGTASHAADSKSALAWQDLERHVLSVVSACRLEGLRALRDEYLRRVARIRELLCLGGYAAKHVALQHEAGVPLGGTFVLVYHDGTLPKDEPQDVYAAALRQLAAGTVLADLCLPERCASDCSAVQTFLVPPVEKPPAGPPTLRAKLGCTSAKSVAKVALSASGGTPDYELRVDGGEPRALAGALEVELAAGTHVLELRDAEGTSGTPLTLQIPAALALSAVEYTDDSAAGTFSARCRVSGGVPPYGASQGTLAADGSLVLAGLKSGTVFELEIVDAAGCATRAEIAHAVAPPCTKPCQGRALRSRYAAWAPRPTKSRPYQYKELASWKLKLTDERGDVLFEAELAKEVLAVLRAQTAVSEVNYAALMTQVCERVTGIVASRLPAELGAGVFALRFDADTGTLVIESYACHTFAIEVRFLLSGELPLRAETWSCSREGIRVTQSRPTQAAFAMPDFGRIELDRCAGTEAKDCRVALKGIDADSAQGLWTLTPAFGGGIDPARLEYHWRLDDAGLTVSRERSVRIKASAQELQVQLLVIDPKTRCWAFVQTQFSAERRSPGRFTRRHR